MFDLAKMFNQCIGGQADNKAQGASGSLGGAAGGALAGGRGGLLAGPKTGRKIGKNALTYVGARRARIQGVARLAERKDGNWCGSTSA